MFEFPYSAENGERVTYAPQPLGEIGLRSHIIRTCRPLMLDDVQTEGSAYGLVVLRSVEHSETQVKLPKSWMGVPLVVGDEPRGVINLYNIERTHAFSESDLRLLGTLAASMSVALENARLFNETTRRASELAALTDIGSEISSTLHLPTVLQRIAVSALQVLDADTVAVFLIEPDGRFLRPVIAVGDIAEQVKRMRPR